MRQQITTREIAAETGYRPDYISHLRNHHSDFPRPVGRHTVGRSSQYLYDRAEMVRWLAIHNKRPLAGGVSEAQVQPLTLLQQFLAGHYAPELQRLAQQCKRQNARLNHFKTRVVHLRGETWHD